MPYGKEKLTHFSGPVPGTTRRAPARSARPCAYGPRGADGYCPKRPSSGRSRTSGGGRPCKYGPRGADGYCPKRPSSGRSRTTTTTSSTSSTRRETPAQRQRRLDDIAASTIELGTGLYAAGAHKKAKSLLRTNVRALPTRGVVGLAVAAGLAAFAGTTAVLGRIRDAKERRLKEQELAAAGYRVARANMEAQLGRPMTRPEHNLLAAEWRDKLPQARR